MIILARHWRHDLTSRRDRPDEPSTTSVWDLGRVHPVDPRTGTLLAPLYPLDRAKMPTGYAACSVGGEHPADATASPTTKRTEMAPLLRRLIDAY